MNDVQKSRLSSLLKSDDFLDENTADTAAIIQIAPLALLLKNKIGNISESP